MKFQKFLKWIHNLLMSNTNIDLKTTKLIMSSFTQLLSNTEYNKYKLQLLTINAITSKQISIDTTIKNNNINELNNQLKGIKNDKKKIKEP